MNEKDKEEKTVTCIACLKQVELPEGWKNPDIVPDHYEDGHLCSGRGIFSKEVMDKYESKEK